MSRPSDYLRHQGEFSISHETIYRHMWRDLRREGSPEQPPVLGMRLVRGRAACFLLGGCVVRAPVSHLATLSFGWEVVKDFTKNVCFHNPSSGNFRAMLRRFGLLLVALALFSIAGGPWAVLQTVAWAGMLHDYTQRTGSFAVAVEQTFDGQHPCEFCREIAAAKVKEHKERPTPPGANDNAKVKAMVVDAAILPLEPPAMLLARTPAAVLSGPSRAERPLIPPPKRGIFAA